MRPIKRLQMGKSGLSDAFVEQVRSIFEKERILKITILRSACRDKKQADEIGRKLVNLLGEKFDYKLVGYVLTVVKYRKAQR
jgi:RNA-binding protein YhbY